MSVLVLDPKVISYIKRGLEYAAHNSVSDALHSSAIWSHFKDFSGVFDESERLMKSLYDLNQYSYSSKYKEQEFSDLYLFVKPTIGIVCPYQLLKYVECLNYNIEPETILTSGMELTDRQLLDIKLFEDWEYDITKAIVWSMEKYDKAQWSNPV